MSETPKPKGYDFFADVSGTRTVILSVETGMRFQTPLRALERLEQTLQTLPGRLQVIHQRGVAYHPALGEEVARLTQRLKQVAGQARESARRFRQSLEAEVAELEKQVEQNDRAIEADGYEPHAEVIVRTRTQAEELKARMESAEEAVMATFADVARETRALEQRVKVLEWSGELLGGATFALEPGESLIQGVEGSYYPGEGEVIQGVLFLTDRQLIFEQRQEVVIKRRFLPFGKKQKVEEVRLREPLERIVRLEVSRPLGSIFRGESLNLKLRPPAEVQEPMFELQGREESWRTLIERARSGEGAPPGGESVKTGEER